MSQPPPHPEIFHIVHVDRLASIIGSGELVSDSIVRTGGAPGTTIGMGTIKASRLTLPVECHRGDHVGDYVPFYFCSRSIMLYVISKANHPELNYRGGQGPIIHLQADLHEAIAWASGQRRRWACSTSNAGARYAPMFADVGRLGEIDWAAVAATNWSAPEVKEGKQAEFLMHRSFPFALVRRIGVHSRAVYAQVQAILACCDHRPKVEIRPDWYY